MTDILSNAKYPVSNLQLRFPSHNFVSISYPMVTKYRTSLLFFTYGLEVFSASSNRTTLRVETYLLSVLGGGPLLKLVGPQDMHKLIRL